MRPPAMGTRVAGRGDVDNQHPDTRKPKAPPPIQDEWGVYDPSRAGFEAVMRLLIEAPGDAAPTKPRPSPKAGAK